MTSSKILCLKQRISVKTAIIKLKSAFFNSEIGEIRELRVWMYNFFLKFGGLEVPHKNMWIMIIEDYRFVVYTIHTDKYIFTVLDKWLYSWWDCDYKGLINISPHMISKLWFYPVDRYHN